MRRPIGSAVLPPQQVGLLADVQRAVVVNAAMDSRHRVSLPLLPFNCVTSPYTR